MNDEGWEARMAARAAQRRERQGAINRENWPGPPELRGASARDAFLWYIRDAWGKFFGGDAEVETLVDSDLGYHVLRRGSWQLTLVDLDQYPGRALDAAEVS